MSGYLSLETHPEHTGIIRLFASRDYPKPPVGHDGGAIRYVARFNDVVTARMNAQNELSRRLVDVNYGTYRSDILEAIARIDALELRHSSVWIDPELDEGSLKRLQCIVQKIHTAHERSDRIWQMVGAMAVGLLLLQLLVFI